MSDLLQLGSQCSHPACNELDFLPIVCRCDRYYCRHHIAPDLHSCPIDPAANNPTGTPLQKLQRCAIHDCNKPSLNAFTATATSPNAQHFSAACSRCHQSFCAIHRHPKSHSCRVEDAPQVQRSETARALLAKNFPTSPKKTLPIRRAPQIPTDPLKLAQYRRVELMKMRHRAIPGDRKGQSSPAPLDQRLHVKVKVDDKTDKVFWFPKTMVTGKVLDCLASHLGMASTDSSRLQLLKVLETHEHALRNDQLFTNEVEEGDLITVARVI